MAADEYFASGGVVSWAVPGQPYPKNGTVPAMLGNEYILPRRVAREWLRTQRLDYLFDPRD